MTHNLLIQRYFLFVQ